MTHDKVYTLIHKLLKRELLKNNYHITFRICKEIFLMRRECNSPYMFPYEKVYVKRKKGIRLGEFKSFFINKLRLYLDGLESSNYRHIFFVQFVFL